jgi:hypothetical protein
LGVSIDKARYWMKKYDNPEWKQGSHGGLDRHKFLPEAKALMVNVILETLQNTPTAPCRMYRLAIMDTLKYRVSLSYVKSLIAGLGLTYEPN